MGTYDVQQVCENGHQITASYHTSPEFRRKFCYRCGAATIHACPNCGAGIKGEYDVPGVVAIGFKTPVPSHCENCGKPYPWTEKKVPPTVREASDGTWSLIDRRIAEVAESRFRSGHYADAVEAALKAVNSRVKAAWMAAGKDERDGADLMFAALDVNHPVIRLGEPRSKSGKSIQDGYKHLFAGAIMGIRNPKAHENVTISERRALHFLIFVSLLMEKLDEAGVA